MLNIDTGTGFYSRREIWFSEQPDPTALAQNTQYYQSRFAPGGNRPFSEFVTLRSDLAQSTESLLQQMSKTTKRHINSAQKEPLEFAEIARDDTVRVNAFLSSKARWEKSRNRKSSAFRFKCLLGSGHLRLYQMALSGRALVYHSYICSGERARLLSSHNDIRFSDAKLTGLANKLLHWKTMQLFKGEGKRIYDWGGINEDLTPGITRFKRSFGGTEERSYNFVLTRGCYGLYAKLRGR